MQILLVRHADAVEADRGMTDFERPLSEEGREKMGKGARGLKKLLGAEDAAGLDAILSSPRLRSMETAKILAREVNGNDRVVECPPLAGEFAWDDLLPHLLSHPGAARIALVGHEPFLGLLAGWLLVGVGSTTIPLRKGSVICFEVDELVSSPAAELLWFATPKQLRMLR